MQSGAVEGHRRVRAQQLKKLDIQGFKTGLLLEQPEDGNGAGDLAV